MVRAGDMRHVVTIEVRSTAQDGAGEQVNSWVFFATRRAALERSPGKEVWASAQRGGRVPVVFRLRYLAGVLPAMRLIHGTKVHNILSAVPDPTGAEELIITAEELVEAPAP